MKSIQEQYEEAGRTRDAIRNGTHSDGGGPVADSADHHLIEQAKRALGLLVPRPSPNGIGYTATAPRTVARLIRDAAQAESCYRCGCVYVPSEESFQCDCEDEQYADKQHDIAKDSQDMQFEEPEL